MNLSTRQHPEPALLHDRVFPKAPRSSGGARDFARIAMTAWAVQPSRIDDMVLCVSELASNAVRHGAPSGRLFLVRLLTFNDTVRIEVHDSGRAWQKPPCTQAPSDATAGRGLFLVDSLSDEWGVLPRTPLGKVVWAEFRL
ncbi:ATP-binding protein [Streptomyces sp. NPDC059994]|uniref:ATP-binding protein n=1 Tax=Streptomyces sp. NPDC059994 TaxID=3347029 RepID=UPI0036A7D7A5